MLQISHFKPHPWTLCMHLGIWKCWNREGQRPVAEHMVFKHMFLNEIWCLESLNGKCPLLRELLQVKRDDARQDGSMDQLSVMMLFEFSTFVVKP